MFETTLLVDPADHYPDLVPAINAIPTRATRGGTARDCDQRLRCLLILSRRLEALLLAEVAAFDDQGFAPALGCKSTGAYLAAHGHLDPAAAHRLVTAARTADRLPRLGAMLAAGDIATDHVAAIGSTTRRLPDHVVAAEDATFATLAAAARPSELRQAGAHLQQMYDTDTVSRDARHLHDSRHLTLGQTMHGAWHLEGILAPEDGVALSLALDSLSAKKGAEDDRSITQRRADALIELATLALRSGQLPDTGGEQPRVTLLLQATSNPFAHHDQDDEGEESDDSQDHGSDAGESDVNAGPTVVLGAGPEGFSELTDASEADDTWLATAPDNDLAGDTITPPAGSCGKAPPGRRPDWAAPPTKSRAADGFSITAFNLADAVLLGATAMISKETLQRICCDAEINIATRDAGGDILNLCQSTRDPNLPQRRAVKIRDKHCVFPGCDTPPHRCQIHHIHYWSQSGCTDLCNLALICAFHHYLIHDKHWILTRTAPTADNPAGGWSATAPDQHQQLRQTRQHAA